MAAIRTEELTKRYPGKRRVPGVRDGSPPVVAVDGLSLAVEHGEVFGFLGPNGAGKSTTINVLLDYVRPTAGRAEVLGMDTQAEPVSLHDRVGVLPENLGLWDRLDARKHLRFVARTKDVDVDPDALLERVGLAGEGDQPVGDFSTGMCQRLALAMALVGDPDLLLLDEPTAGLDPNGVRRLREIIRSEVDDGATVFFSSHVLEQVEAVCDRVGILNDGELVALDTIEGLREERGAGDRVALTLDDAVDGATDAVAGVDGVVDVDADGRELTATCTNGPAKVAAIDAVRETGAEVVDLHVESADLAELFAAYAGDGTPERGARSPEVSDV